LLKDNYSLNPILFLRCSSAVAVTYVEAYFVAPL